MTTERVSAPDQYSRRTAIAFIVGIITLGFGLIASAYWPGIMIDDARWQYQQAVDNSYEDWHPPFMAWVWRRLMFLQPGPAPMFLLQQTLYWSAIGLIAFWAYRRGRPRLGVALAFVGWIPAPLALTGTITKDCLMSGLLGCASGLLLWREVAGSRWVHASLAGIVMTLLLLAAALRFNAFLACVPLALAALPQSITRTKPRVVLAALCATLLFLGVGPVVARLVQAEDMDVQLSLIIFDLGGITEHSGTSAFPDMGVKNPVAVNHGCYDPEQWDGYSSWAKKPCPLGFDRIQSLVDDDDFDPRSAWVNAVLAHPIAYAEHRLAHFNVSTGFLVGESPHFTAWSQSVPNPWGYQVRQNSALKGITAVANSASGTPIGWPIFWISVGLAACVVALWLRLDPVIVAIAASSSLHGLGYLIFGVATGMRYHFWTVSGAALAAVLTAAHCLSRDAPRGALRVAASIVAVPTIMAIAARLAL